MDKALLPFLEAHYKCDAFAVAQFFKPSPVDRLYDFWRSTNQSRVEHDLRDVLAYRNGGPAPDEEDGWVDVLAKFWQASDKIIKADQAKNQGRLSVKHSVDVYDTWKDLVSRFARHIDQGSLPYWTVFTLSVVANDLRRFAIEADTHLAKTEPPTFSAEFSDDIVASTPKNQKLEEAARVFSRIFALCMNDR